MINPVSLRGGSVESGQMRPYAHMSTLRTPNFLRRGTRAASSHTAELQGCSKRNSPPRSSCFRICWTQNRTWLRDFRSNQAICSGELLARWTGSQGGQHTNSSGLCSSNRRSTLTCVLDWLRSHPCWMVNGRPSRPCCSASRQKREENSSATAHLVCASFASFSI